MTCCVAYTDQMHLCGTKDAIPRSVCPMNPSPPFLLTDPFYASSYLRRWNLCKSTCRGFSDFRLDSTFCCLRIYILLPRVANFLPKVLCLLRCLLSVTSYNLNQLWSLGSLDLPHPLPLVEREVLLFFWKHWFTVVNYVFLLYFFFFIDAPIYPYLNKKQRPLAKYFIKRQKCSSRKKRTNLKIIKNI